MKFTKMHGAGNDYIYVDGFRERLPMPAEQLAIAVSRPHFGLGSDGLIVLTPCAEADGRMRIYNNDGSEAMMCGNGVRCAARLLYEWGYAKGDEVRVMTNAGLRTIKLLPDARGRLTRGRVDMGEPVLRPADIPVDLPGERALGVPLTVGGQTLRFTCVSMGNPHAVCFVEDPDQFPVTQLGPLYERHAAFPNRCNIEFAHVSGPEEIHMRVWERGSGETLACGTGACAVLVAAVLNGLSNRAVDMYLPGGQLHILWDEADGHVYMTGPTSITCTGEWLDSE